MLFGLYVRSNLVLVLCEEIRRSRTCAPSRAKEEEGRNPLGGGTMFGPTYIGPSDCEKSNIDQSYHLRLARMTSQ